MWLLRPSPTSAGLVVAVLAAAGPGGAQPPARGAPPSTTAPSPPGRLPCAGDDARLSRAAAALAATPGRLTPARLGRALRDTGVSDVRVRALRVPADDAPERVRRWLVAQGQAGDAPLVCGEAADQGGARVVLASPRGGSLTFVPGRERRLRVALAPGFRDPELVVEDPGGAVRRRPVRTGVVTIPATAARAQLLARGPDGLRPVALLDLRTAVPTAPATPGRDRPAPATPGRDRPAPVTPGRDRPPATPGRDPPAFPARPVERTGDDPANAAENPSPPPGPPAEAVDRWRRRAGVAGPPLRRNRLLSRVAHRHAERVCAAGRATHRGDRGDDPEARLRRAGLAARVVGEVVARGHGPRGAARAVWSSPAHRAVVLDPRFTDLGSALVRRGEDACLVLVFAAWPRPVPPG